MQIQQRVVGGVTILDLRGRMVLGDGDGLLRAKIKNLVQQRHRKLVLNLGGVMSLDSTGLSEIIVAYTTLCRHRGKVKLMNVPNRVRRLLVVSQVLAVFEVFESECEAVHSFSGSSECPPEYWAGRRDLAAELNPTG